MRYTNKHLKFKRRKSQISLAISRMSTKLLKLPYILLSSLIFTNFSLISASISSSRSILNYYQEINPNYNFPTEILLDQADTIDQNLKRRKRNVLVSDNNPDAKALDTPILSSQDSNEPSTNNDFKPLDTEIQDGKVVSKLFTDTVNSKTIKFHRTIFTRSKAHSHAYINWVGNGSPVIFILSVKKNLISAKNEIVEESHLYRSDNYGISWVQVLKSNENGFPENSKIFKYMPSPHDDKTLVFLDNGSKFIKTTNAGVSFETTALDDKLDDIKFHPTETQWLLGYSKSRKQIYYTTNLGSTWTRITDPQIHQVTDHKWNWGEKNIDDSKTIHFEIRIGDPEKVRPKFYPYTCYMEDCFNAKKIHPQQLNNLKVGSINRNSMLVEGGYIMVEKPLGRYGASNDLFISSMTQQADGSSARGEYSAALFTSHENFVDFHVVSAENDYIILGILQLDKRTADLFVSNTNGNTFWLVLPKVDMQAPDPNSGNEFSVDCLSFGKLAGVILCNQQRATKISYNSGANWQEIDVKNNVKICNDPNKTKLNELITENPDKRLRFQLANQHTKKGWYMPKFKLINDGKYGYAYAQGKFGLDFAMNPFDTDLAVYITRDGGVNWECMLEGRNILEMTHYGKQVLTKLTKRFEANTSLRYSADFGKSFHDVTFTDQKIMVDGILTEPGSHTAHFTIFGHQPAGISSDDSSSDSWHIITVDASEVVNNQQTCTSDDYRNWKFTTPDGNKESLGMVRTFKHQIEGNACINNDSILNKDNSMTIVENDNCYMNDYTCGYLYKLVKDERRGEFRCDFDKETHEREVKTNHLYWFDENTSRWPMKIASDKCKKDSSYYKPEFTTKNQEYLVSDQAGFGKSYKFVEKLDTLSEKEENYFGDSNNRGLGDSMTFQLVGKLKDRSKARYDWLVDKLDPETDGWVEKKALGDSDSELNELKFTCQTSGTYRVSVYLSDKDTPYSANEVNEEEAVYTDSKIVNCWERLDEDLINLVCSPVINVGDQVNCRAWQTGIEDEKKQGVTYNFLNSNSPTARIGITTEGVGSVIGFDNFNHVSFSSHVTVKIQNKINRVEEEIDINVRPKIDKPNPLLKLSFDIDFKIDTNSMENLRSIIDLSHELNIKLEDAAKDGNSGLTRNAQRLAYYVYFPDVFKKPRSDRITTSTGYIVLAKSQRRNFKDLTRPSRADYESVQRLLNEKAGQWLVKTPATYYSQGEQKVLKSPPVYYKLDNIQVVDLNQGAENLDEGVNGNTKTKDSKIIDTENGQMYVSPEDAGMASVFIWIGAAIVVVAVLILVGYFGNRFYSQKRWRYQAPDQQEMTDRANIIDNMELNEEDQNY